MLSAFHHMRGPSAGPSRHDTWLAGRIGDRRLTAARRRTRGGGGDSGQWVAGVVGSGALGLLLGAFWLAPPVRWALGSGGRDGWAWELTGRGPPPYSSAQEGPGGRGYVEGGDGRTSHQRAGIRQAGASRTRVWS